VLSRLDGPQLLPLSRSGAMTPAQTGATLASLYRSVHRTPPPAEVLTLRDWLAAMGISGDRIPAPMSTGILALIERLQPEDGLCHGDLHPGNVIMTADGPRLVDWTSAVRAPAAFDLACGYHVYIDLAAETVADPERPRAIYAATLSEYARLAGISQAALTAAMESYLPIARVIQLLWGAKGELRERMIRHIEAALRPEG